MSSAAVPYYSKFSMSGKDFIDGGFCTNNPGYFALKYLEKNGIKMEDVNMLSISCNTDINTSSLNVSHLKESVFHAESGLLASLATMNNCMDNLAYSHILLCNEILRHRFVRLDPMDTKNISLDNVDSRSVFLLKKNAKLMANFNEKKNQFVFKSSWV